MHENSREYCFIEFQIRRADSFEQHGGKVAINQVLEQDVMKVRLNHVTGIYDINIFILDQE